MYKIGVISDTHDFLDPRVFELFTGVDHILHAGDIGRPEILRQLGSIAPVTAVSGNTDDPGFRYPLIASTVLDGRQFLVHHIIAPASLTDALKERIHRDQPAAVVFGHTHRPFCQTVEKVFYFNPGYAGKSRFGMERSLAILHCEKERLRPEYYPL